MNFKKVFLLLLVFAFVSTAFVTTLQAQNVTVQRGERTITNPDGSVYVGQVRNMLPHGRGTMTFPDGRTVTGQWRNGQLQGEQAVAQQEQRTKVQREHTKTGSKVLSIRTGIGLSDYSHSVRSQIPPWDYTREKVTNSLSVGGGMGFSYFFMDNFAFTAELNYDYLGKSVHHATIPAGINWFFGKYFFTGAGLYYGLHKHGWRGFDPHPGIFLDFGLAFESANNNIYRIFARYNHSFNDAKTRILSLNLAYGFLF